MKGIDRIMEINFDNLFSANDIKIKEDVSNIDTILDYEQILLVISKSIINYRIKNGLTQKELANKLQVNQVMISKLERGRYNPTVKLLYNISRKLTKSVRIGIPCISILATIQISTPAGIATLTALPRTNTALSRTLYLMVSHSLGIL